MRGAVREGVVTLRHLLTIRKGGRVYRYLRLPGKKLVALPDLPLDDPAFLAAYAAAMNGGKPRAKPGTIAALVESYLASPVHAGHSRAYAAMIRHHADAIRAQAADAPARRLAPSDVQDDLRPLDPHAAQKRLKAWRLICAHGTASGLLTTDPTTGVRRPRTPPSDGHEPWTADDLARFRDRWPIGTSQRAAMELLFWTGARISDAVRLGPGMVDRDGVLTFRQAKTGDPAHVPWSCAMPGYAEGMESDRALCMAALAAVPRHMTYLTTVHGKPRSHKALGGYVSEAADAAGFDKSAHGLRKARAVALAEAGATPHQLAAWTGHRSLSEVERYTRRADRRRAVMGTEQAGKISKNN